MVEEYQANKATIERLNKSQPQEQVGEEGERIAA